MIVSFLSCETALTFPKEVPTISETAASPVTFTMVRHMSNGRSIAKISARPASGMPACAKTMTNITMPALGTAAVPIEASVVVKITVGPIGLNPNQRPEQ